MFGLVRRGQADAAKWLASAFQPITDLATSTTSDAP
jgi:hypothetical protein